MQMDDAQKLFIVIQIAQALFYLHTANPALVHSDVKPSNILVRPLFKLYYNMCRAI